MRFIGIFLALMVLSPREAIYAADDASARIDIISSAGLRLETFFDAGVPEGAVGVITGGLQPASEAWKDLLAAGGWNVVGLQAEDPQDLAGERGFSVNRPERERKVAFHTIGGHRLAFICVTMPAAGGETVGIVDPDEALIGALSVVPQGIPVILVVDGTRMEAADILRRVQGVDLCIVSGKGSGDPAPLRVGNSWLVEAPWGGGQWGVTTLDLAEGRIERLEHRFERPWGIADAVSRVRQRHGLTPVPVDALLRSEPARKEKPGIVQTVANRACRLRVHGMRIAESYGNLRYPGGQLLVLDVALENIIPMTLVREVGVPTEYRMENAADHLYVVINGNRLARILPDADQVPGHIPVRGFRLARLGDRIRGNVVFGMPPGAVESMELRLYDFAHGHAQLTLSKLPLEHKVDKPVVDSVSNEIVEAAIVDVYMEDTLDGRGAPDGMVYVAMDLRARSQFTFEVDATAFDPRAGRGEKIEVGTVADWLEARKYTHLIVDSEYAYTPDPLLSTLEEDPRFLPDLMTGGRVVFMVPETYATLTLRGDFPNARLPDGEVIRPQPILFAVKGVPIEPPDREALWRIEDDPIEVMVTRMDVVGSFAGIHAGAGQQFLTLNVTVRNRGDKPEFFQTDRQLQYVDPQGRQSAPHAATYAGRVRPAEHVWVPNGEQRTFQMAYLTGRDELQPRLAYNGFTRAEIVNLPALGAPLQVAVHEPEDLYEVPSEVEVPVGTEIAGQEILDEVAIPADDEERPITGPARMHVVAAEEVASWVRQRNMEGVNLALRSLGAELYTDATIPEAQLREWHNGRFDSTRRTLSPGSYRIRLAGAGAANVYQVALVAERWSERLRLTVEAADGRGGYQLLAHITGIEEQALQLRVLEFDPVETEEIRLTVEDRIDSNRRLPTMFFEVMVFEGPLADKSESVLSRGGAIISRMEHGGSVFHTWEDHSWAGELLTDPDESRYYFRSRWRSGDNPWLEPVTLAFQANREALISEIELWPAQDEARRGHMPDRIRISTSVDEPFEGYTLVGEYAVSLNDDAPWKLRFDDPIRARFVRVEFKYLEDIREVSLGEIILREGTAEGYQSVLIRGDATSWRHRDQATLTSLMGDEADEIRVVTDAQHAESVVETGLNQWVGSMLDRPAQRHVYRVRLTHDWRVEIPELQVHMAPFLRGHVRLLDMEGRELNIPQPERRGGTTLTLPLDVEPGEYQVEVASAPIYLFMVFDSSGSMGRAIPITRATLPELTDNLPEGVYVALGSSRFDRENRKSFTLYSEYTRDGVALRHAATKREIEGVKMFDTGGGSDWYNFLRDMLEWADENTPPGAVGAKVLVADGVGNGDYPSMWDRLRQTAQRLYTVGWGSQTLRLDHADRHVGWTAARGLFNVAWFCGGRYFEPQADHELVETYQAILRDVQTPAHYALRVNTRPRQQGRLVTIEPPARGARPILFVLDASGSMLIDLEGRTRMAVALDVIEQVINSLPDNAHVGLRVYGHRFRAFGADRERAATDSELLIPIGPMNRAAFIRTVRGINARGATPLAHTIEQLPRDLRRVEKPLVIVLTDGVESFRRDPVIKSARLREAHPDMEYVVVGFMIDQMTDRDNLRGMADAGGGLYYNAMDSASLVHSLEQAINPTIRYMLYDENDNEVAAGIFGDTHELFEGQYRIHAVMMDGQAILPVAIQRGRTVRIAEADLPEPEHVGEPVMEEREKERAVEPAIAPRFCTQCGQRLADGVRFCPGCGIMGI